MWMYRSHIHRCVWCPCLRFTTSISSKASTSKSDNVQTILHSLLKEQNYSAAFIRDFKKNFLLGYKSTLHSDKQNKNAWMAYFDFFYSTWMIGVVILVVYAIYSSVEIQIETIGFDGKSKHRIHPRDIPKVSFGDVKGADEVKAELEEFVSYLKNPSKIGRLGGRMPKGILMIGPPGVGKTLLAKAMAGESRVPFFYANASEFDGMYVGSGAKMIRSLYDEAAKNTPCVVFIDEIDAVAPLRLVGNSGSPYTSRDTIDQLLAALDGFKNNQGVLTIGATNFPNKLDPALTRPGRFDSKVTVGAPDRKGRAELLNHFLDKVKKASELDVEMLARKTIGFTGADISNIVNQAALSAARLGRKEVSQKDLEEAVNRARNGKEEKSKKYSSRNIKVISSNQAGHALMALLLGREVNRCTILPVDGSRGKTILVPTEREHSVRVEQLRQLIVINMAGRAAEELLRQKEPLSVYSAVNIQKAFQEARQLIISFGYSQKVGIISGQDVISDGTRTLIDQEAERVVQECYQEALSLLQSNKSALLKLEKELEQREALSGHEIASLIGIGQTNKS